MKPDPETLRRFTASEPVNHWLVAIVFFLLAFSGLAFFHPDFYPLNQLFGGGTWTRILHPFFGVALIFFFGGMFFRFRKLSKMTPADREWLKRASKLAQGDERNLPEAGKLNGGQKLMFWSLVTSVALLVVSGLVIWRAYLSFLFPAGVVRFSAVVHAAAGVVMIGLIMGHIYLAIWSKESI